MFYRRLRCHSVIYLSDVKGGFSAMLLMALGVPLLAQWNYPTAGVPRTPEIGRAHV